jgi:hypothetical protein
MHVGGAQRLPDRRAHAVEVARHRDIETGDLPPVAVEKIDVGLPDLAADQISAAGRTDDRVGDLGIGDQHIANVAREVDHDRFPDADGDKTRGRIAGGEPGGPGRHVVVAGRNGGDSRGVLGGSRPDRIGPCGEGKRRGERGGNEDLQHGFLRATSAKPTW